MADGELEFRVVLGVIEADCHAVGYRILAATLRGACIDVVNPGVLASQEESMEAATDNMADAILVSVIYGHGALDCQQFRDRCDEHGLKNIVLCVCGNLV